MLVRPLPPPRESVPPPTTQLLVILEISLYLAGDVPRWLLLLSFVALVAAPVWVDSAVVELQTCLLLVKLRLTEPPMAPIEEDW